MKLRNKQTGEIVVFGEGVIDLNQIGCKNVAEMIEAGWEDYKEPKEYWWIDTGSIPMVRKSNNPILSTAEDIDKEIGNYFETEEEAEKAVEKLKAYKRLKDKGVVLHSFEGAESCENLYRIIFSVRCDRYWSDSSHSVDADLNLLFGGEE